MKNIWIALSSVLLCALLLQPAAAEDPHYNIKYKATEVASAITFKTLDATRTLKAHTLNVCNYDTADSVAVRYDGGTAAIPTLFDSGSPPTASNTTNVEIQKAASVLSPTCWEMPFDKSGVTTLSMITDNAGDGDAILWIEAKE